MWEPFQHLTNVQQLVKLMLTSQALGQPKSPYTAAKNSFQLSNRSVFLESCIARQSTPILDFFNTSNLTSPDLSALQGPGRFKDRVPGNLNQPGYPGWNPERQRFHSKVPETKDLVHPGPHARHFLCIARPMVLLFSLFPFGNRASFATIHRFHQIVDDVYSGIRFFSSLREANAPKARLRDRASFRDKCWVKPFSLGFIKLTERPREFFSLPGT